MIVKSQCSRRDFIAAALAGTGALMGLRPGVTAAAEPPPETTRLRIPWVPSTCRSPEWAAEELLRAEGFTELEYLMKDSTQGMARALATGEADIGGHFAAPVILRIEAGDPIVMLGGEHVGCFELLGADHIRAIRDLKGRTVAVPELDPSPPALESGEADQAERDQRGGRQCEKGGGVVHPLLLRLSGREAARSRARACFPSRP